MQHLRLLACASAPHVLTAGSAMVEKPFEGDELRLDVPLGPRELIAQVPVPAKQRPSADEASRIAIGQDDLDLFNAASGQSILL